MLDNAVGADDPCNPEVGVDLVQNESGQEAQVAHQEGPRVDVLQGLHLILQAGAGRRRQNTRLQLVLQGKGQDCLAEVQQLEQV